ncbi:hypothetical protein [Paraburkholderia sp. BCC1886]|uniref:hypothetical protein n=1 Tax=Paraburkholderia sp. BCC1886 TaxID=2562670 RepID=UPI001182EBE3|nr:hypothetical protein [Paraburkholderia sp. BCC1886]
MRSKAVRIRIRTNRLRRVSRRRIEVKGLYVHEADLGVTALCDNHLGGFSIPLEARLKAEMQLIDNALWGR